MKLNLQFFGGRGGSSGGGSGGGRAGGASKDGTLTKSSPREIETTYHQGHGFTRGYYNDTVLQAKTNGQGGLTFDYADWTHSDPSAKTNRTHAATTTITHGAINGELYGVDLSKAKSVSGQTYDLRDKLKRAGFRWNGKEKRWEK